MMALPCFLPSPHSNIIPLRPTGQYWNLRKCLGRIATRSKASFGFPPLLRFSTTWGICFFVKGDSKVSNEKSFDTVLPRSMAVERASWLQSSVIFRLTRSAHSEASKRGLLPSRVRSCTNSSNCDARPHYQGFIPTVEPARPSSLELP